MTNKDHEMNHRLSSLFFVFQRGKITHSVNPTDSDGKNSLFPFFFTQGKTVRQFI